MTAKRQSVWAKVKETGAEDAERKAGKPVGLYFT